MFSISVRSPVFCILQFLCMSALAFFALYSVRALLVIRVTGIQCVPVCIASIRNLKVHFSLLDADEKV